MTNEVAREYREALDDRIMAGLSNIKEVMWKVTDKNYVKCFR